MKRTIVKLKGGEPLILKAGAKVRVVHKPRARNRGRGHLRKTTRRPIAKEAMGAYALDVFSRLKQAYPDAHCELDHQTPLQLLMATILSAQCTDKRVASAHRVGHFDSSARPKDAAGPPRGGQNTVGAERDHDQGGPTS